MLKEGFWHSEGEPDLPKPKVMAKASEWVKTGGPEKFARLLNKVQTRARKRHFKGWSTCRICGRSNGSSEFSYKNVVWPSGLMHYIVDHNVKPSDQFIKFIIREVKGGLHK